MTEEIINLINSKNTQDVLFKLNMKLKDDPINSKKFVIFLSFTEIGGLTKIYFLINSLSQKNYNIIFLTLIIFLRAKCNKLYSFNDKIKVVTPKLELKLTVDI